MEIFNTLRLARFPGDIFWKISKVLSLNPRMFTWKLDIENCTGIISDFRGQTTLLVTLGVRSIDIASLGIYF